MSSTFLVPRLVKMLDCDLKPIEVIVVECPLWLASSIVSDGFVWPDQQFFNQFSRVADQIHHDINAGDSFRMFSQVLLYSTIFGLIENYDVNSHLLALEAGKNYGDVTSMGEEFEGSLDLLQFRTCVHFS